MKKIISLVLIGFILSGCSLFRIHKRDIAQGNIITQGEVSRLHIGMTPLQVKEIMGNPVLVNIFSNERLEYVYTFQPGYGNRVEKRLICLFQYGRLREILGT